MKYFLDLEFTPVGEYQECLSIGRWLKPRLIDLTVMERRMAIALNQTFLYERKMLLRFAKYLGFPLQTSTRWDQELEAYLHLIRYSKGLVIKKETPIVLERLSLQLSPWNQQRLYIGE